jgi:hypothetical protein
MKRECGADGRMAELAHISQQVEECTAEREEHAAEREERKRRLPREMEERIREKELEMEARIMEREFRQAEQMLSIWGKRCRWRETVVRHTQYYQQPSQFVPPLRSSFSSPPNALPMNFYTSPSSYPPQRSPTISIIIIN